MYAPSYLKTASLAAALIGLCTAAIAGPALVTPDGTFVQIDAVGSGRFTQALYASVLHADGTSEAEYIPGTADRRWDAFPNLALDPDTNQPALVWSRFNGLDFDVVISSYDGKRWTAPLPLVNTPDDEIHPRAFTAPGEGLHVIWTTPGQRRSFHYALFRAATGVPVREPEILRLSRFFPSQGGATEGGGDDPGINPGADTPPGSGGGTGNGGTGSGGGGGKSSDGSCTSQDQICRESATPGGSSDRCGRFSVILEIGQSQCLLVRNDAGWMRGICAPAGVDLEKALDGTRLSCER